MGKKVIWRKRKGGKAVPNVKIESLGYNAADKRRGVSCGVLAPGVRLGGKGRGDEMPYKESASS